MPLSDADIISAQLYSNAGDNRALFNEKWEGIKKLTNELSNRGVVGIDGILQQYMYIRRAKDKEYVTSGAPNVTTPGLRNYYLTIKKELLKEPLELCGSFEKITIFSSEQKMLNSASVGNRQVPSTPTGLGKALIAAFKALRHSGESVLLAGSVYSKRFLAHNTAVLALSFTETT